MPPKAPVVIDWYRSPLPSALFKELHKRSNAQGWWQTGGYLGIMLGTGALSVWSWLHWPWWATVLGVFAHGMVMAFLPNGIHELGHNTVFRTKALNAFFLYILGFLGWHQFVFFDASHQRHHRYTMHPPDDMEIVMPFILRWKQFWQQGFINLPLLKWALPYHFRLACGKFQGVWELHCLPEEDPALRRAVSNWSRIVLIGHTLIITASIVSGWWILGVLISGGGWIGHWLFWLCNNAQHTGLVDNVPDFRLCCRTIHIHPLVSFLYWRMNYHTEHHMYAAVPCYNLKRLHEAIAHDLPPCPRGLIATWKHIDSLLRRQRADANYRYVATLPPSAAPTPQATVG